MDAKCFLANATLLRQNFIVSLCVPLASPPLPVRGGGGAKVVKNIAPLGSTTADLRWSGSRISTSPPRSRTRTPRCTPHAI